MSVTNPAAGVFCIKPVAGVSPAKVVPTVSTEFTGTSVWAFLAQWSTTRSPCPAGTIRVTGLRAGGGAGLNAVAFTLVID